MSGGKLKGVWETRSYLRNVDMRYPNLLTVTFMGEFYFLLDDLLFVYE